jgi:S-adenosylmethionine:tRNA ribosyltransferase-isomerase
LGVLMADFNYSLPPDLIAQAPAKRRHQSRLLVLHRETGAVEHQNFGDFPGYLRAGDVLVINDSRVIPARLRGINRRTSGEFEVLLVEENCSNDWWAMLRPGKRAPLQTEIEVLDSRGNKSGILATVTDINAEGHRRLQFTGTKNIGDNLENIGEMPLPPYIKREPFESAPEDFERYQTVYAQPKGSVAAPTAGLHFTDALLAQLRQNGVRICPVTLHVGLGTFAPVKADALADHVMHEERFSISVDTAEAINAAKREQRRVIAIGTTTVRVLESVASDSNLVTAGSGRTRIFIYPPRRFRIADVLLTNFHLPRSTLLMLVSAFAAPGETKGRDLILSVYADAIAQRYRFFSYGDAMLML